MSIEWLLVGLPVTFLLGWLAARADIRHILKSAKEYPNNIFGGVANLIVGDKQRALQNLTQAADNIPSVSLQFLIGQLAQEQGDFECAMRVHQQLHEREDIPVEERNRALWALANDYYRMGYFDYTESYALSLRADNNYKEAAFNLLLDVYQRRRQFTKAIELLEEKGSPQSLVSKKTLSYFYCMAAQLQLDKDKQLTLYNKALKTNAVCVLAQLSIAKHWLTQGDAQQSQQFYQYIEHQNPLFLWMAVEGLVTAGQQLGEQTAALTTVERWLHDYPSAQLFKSVYAVCEKQQQAVDKICATYLQQKHSYLAAAYWLEQQNCQIPTKELLQIKSLLLAADKNQSQFVCRQCDYHSTDFTWSCPGCLQWETLAEKAN